MLLILIEAGRVSKHRKGVPYTSDLKQKMLNVYWGYMNDHQRPSLVKRQGYAFTALHCSERRGLNKTLEIKMYQESYL